MVLGVFLKTNKSSAIWSPGTLVTNRELRGYHMELSVVCFHFVRFENIQQDLGFVK